MQPDLDRLAEIANHVGDDEMILLRKPNLLALIEAARLGQAWQAAQDALPEGG